MRLARRCLAPVLALAAFTGCDSGNNEETPAAPSAAEAAVDDAKDEAEDDAKDAKDAEDKGTAELTLGDDGELWKAKRASAKIKDDGKLRISASVQTISEGRATRRQLTLYITDYKGPGKYVIKSMNSNLTAVSLNLDKIKKAEAEGDKAKTDEAAKDAAVDGIKGGSVMLLKDAQVEITKADDDFIDGSISWSGIAMNGPGKLSGTFHARIKK